MSETFKNFNLFNDIEDVALRNRNRAVVLANIAEDNTKNRLITPKGASLILGYFNALMDADKRDVASRFQERMIQRGYASLTN